MVRLASSPAHRSPLLDKATMQDHCGLVGGTRTQRADEVGLGPSGIVINNYILLRGSLLTRTAESHRLG